MLNTKTHPEQAQICQYTKLDNGIHRFVITQGTRLAADQFAAHLEQLFITCANQPFERILIDASSNAIPVVYTVRKMQELIKRYPQRPILLGATLIDNSFVAMLDSMVALLRIKDKMRYFKPYQYDEAINWILCAKLNLHDSLPN